MVVVAITQNFVIEHAITEALHHLELEALIREEEAAQKSEAKEEAVAGISVEELASFTLSDMVEVVEDDYDDDYEDEDRDEDFSPGVSVLTPDAGKIRFAEDIVG
jgi:hypothetical protein